MGRGSPIRIGWTLCPKYVLPGGSIASNLEGEMAPWTTRGLSSAPFTTTITVANGPVCPYPCGGLLLLTRFRCIAHTRSHISTQTDFRKLLPRRPRAGNAIGDTLRPLDGFIFRSLLHPKRQQWGIAKCPSCVLMRRAGTSEALK